MIFFFKVNVIIIANLLQIEYLRINYIFIIIIFLLHFSYVLVTNITSLRLRATHTHVVVTWFKFSIIERVLLLLDIPFHQQHIRQCVPCLCHRRRCMSPWQTIVRCRNLSPWIHPPRHEMCHHLCQTLKFQGE